MEKEIALILILRAALVALAVILVSASMAFAQVATLGPPTGQVAPLAPQSILDEPLAPRGQWRPMAEDDLPGVSPKSDALQRPTRPTGGGNPMGGVGPMGGGQPGYDVTWYPSRSVTDQSANLGFVRQGLNFGAPIWKEGGDMVLATAGIRNTLFSGDTILPETGRAFPDQLWNVTIGLNAKHRFDNGWTGMLFASFGSASDKPFHSVRELTGNLGGLLRIPAANKRDFWSVGALYLFNNQVNFPFPILSYGWNPSERLQVNIGLPFSVNWKPSDEWTFAFSYFPLLNINSRLTYAFDPSLRFFGGYEYLTETYLLAGRTNTRDQFFSIEQRLIAGIQWDLWKGANIEVNGGYSFGRFYGEGDNQFSSLRDKVDIGSGPFLGAAFRWKF